MPDAPFRTWHLPEEGHASRFKRAGQRAVGVGADFVHEAEEGTEAQIRIWQDPPREVKLVPKEVDYVPKGGKLGVLKRKARALLTKEVNTRSVTINLNQALELVLVCLLKEGLATEEEICEFEANFKRFRVAGTGEAHSGIPTEEDASETGDMG